MHKHHSLVSALILACSILGINASTPAETTNIVFETEHLRYAIDTNGSNINFVDKHTGKDHLSGAAISHFALLSHAGKQIAGRVLRCDPNRQLELAFGDSRVRAVIVVTKRDDYLTFEVKELSNAESTTSLTFLNLSLNLKGEPDEPFAACAVDLNIQTFNSNIPGFNTNLQINLNSKDGFVGGSFAVVGCPGSELQTVLKEVIRDHKNLPQTEIGGPWAADAQITRGSYLIATGEVSERNIDDWIKTAQAVGAKQIDIHCGKALKFGDLEPNPEVYPNGLKSLQKVVEKIHEAGLVAGLHTYAFYMAKDSKWVTPVPDPRLGKHRTFTLAGDLDPKTNRVVVLESTKGISTVTGFQVPNSVTLQIGDELVIFSAVETNPPYAFINCTRGALGTKATAHLAGARISQLRELFGLFNPHGDSTLFDEVAHKTAEVYNTCGFDMIYLDAIDGAGAVEGSHTPSFYQAKFIFELSKHLKKPALMEMSSFDSHFWFARSRMGAWDVPSKSYKLFINNHSVDNSRYAKAFLPRNLGWWAIWDWTPKDRMRMHQDDIEYLLCKSLASGDSLSWIECFTPDSYAKSPSQQRFGSLIKQYEELRLSEYFSKSTRDKLSEIGQDFRLEKSVDNQWQFRAIKLDKRLVEVTRERSDVWTTTNTYSDQPLQLRIEANLSLAAYDEPGSQMVETFEDPAKYSEVQSQPGTTVTLASAASLPGKPPFPGHAILRYSATNAVSKRLDSWCMATRTFETPFDLSKRGFGVWVYGDGKGEVLNFMWKAPANVCMGLDEHYVLVDFKGWRYFEFLEPESDSVGNYNWPYRRPTGAPYVETAWVAYDQLNSLTIGCINIPEGQAIECFVSPIKALAHVPAKILNPSVAVSGMEIVFPVELESGFYIDFRTMSDCKLYGPKGELIRELKPRGEVPILKAGENKVEFSCEVSTSGKARAIVTVISQSGDALTK